MFETPVNNIRELDECDFENLVSILESDSMEEWFSERYVDDTSDNRNGTLCLRVGTPCQSLGAPCRSVSTLCRSVGTPCRSVCMLWRGEEKG